MRYCTVVLCSCLLGCQQTQDLAENETRQEGGGANIVLWQSFDHEQGKGEAWNIYHYNGGIEFEERGPDYYPVSWESSGGVRNSGYIWADDSRWRIDTPEEPDSILAFIYYRKWVGGPKLDLRNAEISVFLRGDGLDLKGAKCYFWVNVPHNRWHYTGHPLQVSMETWGTEQTFVLKNDESLWTRTYALTEPASLDRLLREAHSYGFSFIGFPDSDEVTGKFSMDLFRISARIADMR